MELEETRDRMVRDMLKNSISLCTDDGGFHSRSTVRMCTGEGEVLAEGILTIFQYGVGIQMTSPIEIYGYQDSNGDDRETAAGIFAGLYVDYLTLMQNKDSILGKLKRYPDFEKRYLEVHNGKSDSADPFGQFFEDELSLFHFCGNPRMLIYNLWFSDGK